MADKDKKKSPLPETAPQPAPTIVVVPAAPAPSTPQAQVGNARVVRGKKDDKAGLDAKPKAKPKTEEES
ncbi:hypothetical protein [Haliangium sp.]|uniref:hypothetical protein n=1 Tax=Haliangium sp. TaxID=2663208 RepID=UPI003D139EC4